MVATFFCARGSRLRNKQENNEKKRKRLKKIAIQCILLELHNDLFSISLNFVKKKIIKKNLCRKLINKNIFQR
jgi:hypothetical protein